ncbi:MAG: type IV pilus assembly protein PilM [Candidatus Doudnabacteria bacterium]|nr:type IV pilus assembly protein PilM [Candidatus Doudnabacteria bacterium]
MIFAPKKINAIGIDISESSIKVMQLSKYKGMFLPAAFSSIDLPPTMVANHMISDESKMAEYITRALTAAKKINTKYAVVSVPEAKSFVRILKMPQMPESELDGAIPWELEQDIPVPIDQVYLDWQIVKEGDDGHNHVLVMATPRDYVDALVNALKMAKLKPIALELESQATARALIGPEEQNQATLVIDMTTMLTSFVIVSGKGVLEYTSNIPVGGNHLTESISRNLGISLKEAEKIKRESGLMAESKKGNIRQAMLPVLDSIIDEIRNVTKFHEDHSVLSPGVNKIIISGGGASLTGLVDYITARLNVGAGKPIDRIVLADPFVNTMPKENRPEIMSDQEGMAYSTAIGLALRGMNS